MAKLSNLSQVKSGQNVYTLAQGYGNDKFEKFQANRMKREEKG